MDALLQELEGANAGQVPADAGKALKKLEVSPPGSMAGYDREDFPHTCRSSGGTFLTVLATSGRPP